MGSWTLPNPNSWRRSPRSWPSTAKTPGSTSTASGPGAPAADAGATFQLILPRDFTLEEVHREVKELEQVFNAHFGGQADILIHTDPCEEPVCPICGYDPCKLRQEEVTRQRLWQSQVITADADQTKDVPPPVALEPAGKTHN